MKLSLLSKKQVVYLLLLVPFVRLEAFMHIEAVSLFYDLSKLAVLVLISILTMYNYMGKNAVIDRFLFLISLLFVWGLFTVIYHQTNIFNYIVSFATMMALPLLLGNIFRQDDTYDFLTAASAFFKILLIANLITLIVFPDGIYQEASRREGYIYDEAIGVDLLGKANACTPIIMAMVMIIMLRSITYKKRLTRSDMMCIFTGWLIITIQFSATGVIGLFAFIILMIYFASRRKIAGISKRINFNVFLYGALLGTVAVCVFSVQNHFAGLIELVFHKDVTLSNRINVWTMSSTYIESNFNAIDYIVGKGLFDYSNVVFSGRYAHCHNQFLNLFFGYGAVGVIIYVRLFIITLKNLNNQYRISKNKSCILIGSTVIAFVIMFIAEVYTTPLIMMVLYLGYRYNEKIEMTK